MAKLIIPKTYVQELGAPLIFLAGPIRSAPNWQDEAINLLFSQEPYLVIASKTGAILFWLPGEAEHDCQKVYGAMTRVEIGQWMTRYNFDKHVRFCVGSDGKFPELNIIEFDLKMDAYDKDIKKTLEETCSEAVRLAHQK